MGLNGQYILSKKIRIAVLLIIILSIALRLFLCLFMPPYDNDELFLLNAAKNFADKGELISFSYLFEPALIDAVLTGSFYKIIGSTSYFAGRTFEMFWGIASIVLVFLIGTYFYRNKDIGIISAFFVSTAFPHILFSVVCLKYMKASFFFLIAVYLLCRSIEEDKKGLSFIAGIFFAVAFLIKFFVIISLIPFLLLIFHKRYRKGLFFCLLGSLLGFMYFLWFSFGKNFLIDGYSGFKNFIIHFAEDSLFIGRRSVLSHIPAYLAFNPLIFLLFPTLMFLKSKNILDNLILYMFGIFTFYIVFNPYFHYFRLWLPVFPLICISAARAIHAISMHSNFKKIKIIIFSVLLINYIWYIINFFSFIMPPKFSFSLAAIYAEDTLGRQRADTLLIQTGGYQYYNDFGKVIFLPLNKKFVYDAQFAFYITNKERGRVLSRNRVYDNSIYVIESNIKDRLDKIMPNINVYLAPLFGNIVFDISELYFSGNEQVLLCNRSNWSKNYNLLIETTRAKKQFNLSLKGNCFASLPLEDTIKNGEYIRVTAFSGRKKFEIFRNAYAR